MSLEVRLADEIKKWAIKLENTLSTTKVKDERGGKMLSNVEAYRKDSKHFLERGDLINSFECLIWAWALLEIGKELDHLG